MVHLAKHCSTVFLAENELVKMVVVVEEREFSRYQRLVTASIGKVVLCSSIMIYDKHKTNK